MAAVEKILLGYGIFTIGGLPIGLTRGGGSFSVETEYRDLEADGDKGPVKERTVIDKQVAKLKVKALTTFSADDMAKYYPGLEVKEGEVSSNLTISETDYQEVKWEGKTLAGKPVTLILENAINLGNIELTLEDKNEVVPELEFTATYLEASRNTPPWRIVYGVAI